VKRIEWRNDLFSASVSYDARAHHVPSHFLPSSTFSDLEGRRDAARRPKVPAAGHRPLGTEILPHSRPPPPPLLMLVCAASVVFRHSRVSCVRACERVSIIAIFGEPADSVNCRRRQKMCSHPEVHRRTSPQLRGGSEARFQKRGRLQICRGLGYSSLPKTVKALSLTVCYDYDILCR